MQSLSKELKDILERKKLRFCTAESCTGGMVSAAITDIPGSSNVFDRGFITYSNNAKIEMLDVKKSTLDTHGAVSSYTAIEMAIGALKNSSAQMAVSITGIAGPEGGNDVKPIGLVYIGICAVSVPAKAYEHHFIGNRHSIRKQSVEAAFKHMIQLLDSQI